MGHKLLVQPSRDMLELRILARDLGELDLEEVALLLQERGLSNRLRAHRHANHGVARPGSPRVLCAATCG